jgi:hypothetical protein
MNITLGLIVSYVVGVPLTLFGLLLTIQTPLGLVPLLAGVLIIPVVRRQLAARAGIEFSRGAAAGIGTFGVIAFVVILVIVALSGGGGAGGAPGADVSNVSVTTKNANPADSSTTLSVEWNSRAQSAVDPDPDDLSTYSSNDGQKFVVIRVRVTNEGGESAELTPRMFRLQSSGVEYEYQALFGSGNSLSDVTVNPGGTHSAWAAFSVPEDLTEARLIIYQGAFFRQNVSVSFTHNEQMPIEMDD